jgi:hypothetical protein
MVQYLNTVPYCTTLIVVECGLICGILDTVHLYVKILLPRAKHMLMYGTVRSMKGKNSPMSVVALKAISFMPLFILLLTNNNLNINKVLIC